MGSFIVASIFIARLMDAIYNNYFKAQGFFHYIMLISSNVRFYRRYIANYQDIVVDVLTFSRKESGTSVSAQPKRSRRITTLCLPFTWTSSPIRP